MDDVQQSRNMQPSNPIGRHDVPDPDSDEIEIATCNSNLLRVKPVTTHQIPTQTGVQTGVASPAITEMTLISHVTD